MSWLNLFDSWKYGTTEWDNGVHRRKFIRRQPFILTCHLVTRKTCSLPMPILLSPSLARFLTFRYIRRIDCDSSPCDIRVSYYVYVQRDISNVDILLLFLFPSSITVNGYFISACPNLVFTRPHVRCMLNEYG